MEKPAFDRVNLSDVRGIIAVMRVPMVEFLCQVSMGRILILTCILLGVRGCLWQNPACPLQPR
jgi:hypothetical protein